MKITKLESDLLLALTGRVLDWAYSIDVGPGRMVVNAWIKLFLDCSGCVVVEMSVKADNMADQLLAAINPYATKMLPFDDLHELQQLMENTKSLKSTHPELAEHD